MEPQSRVPNSYSRSHLAIVRDVDVRHEQVVVAELRDETASGGADAERRELADLVAVPEEELPVLAAVLEVLREAAELRMREDPVLDA